MSHYNIQEECFWQCAGLILANDDTGERGRLWKKFRPVSYVSIYVSQGDCTTLEGDGKERAGNTQRVAKKIQPCTIAKKIQPISFP